jgi:DNA-binding XRE family transcriptional regulator
MRNERLKLLRERLDITQQAMGKCVGLSKANIRDLESGKVKISTLHALAFEHVLNVNSVWLLNGEGQMFIGEKDETGTDSNRNVLNYDDKIESEHLKLIKQFKNKELAKNINSKLIKLESIDPDELEDIDVYIDLRISRNKQKKTSNPMELSGTDRRKNRAS